MKRNPLNSKGGRPTEIPKEIQQLKIVKVILYWDVHTQIKPYIERTIWTSKTQTLNHR